MVRKHKVRHNFLLVFWCEQILHDVIISDFFVLEPKSWKDLTILMHDVQPVSRHEQHAKTLNRVYKHNFRCHLRQLLQTPCSKSKAQHIEVTHGAHCCCCCHCCQQRYITKVKSEVEPEKRRWSYNAKYIHIPHETLIVQRTRCTFPRPRTVIGLTTGMQHLRPFQFW